MVCAVSMSNKAHQNDNEPASPRICAVATPQNSHPFNRLQNPSYSGSQDSPRELPPPPAQIIERYLSERGAVAIEINQFDAWIQMESDFYRINAELENLQCALKEKEGDQAKLEELANALEEQRQMAQKAKEALKAVREAAENTKP